jgi:hypothetical protein
MGRAQRFRFSRSTIRIATTSAVILATLVPLAPNSMRASASAASYAYPQPPVGTDFTTLTDSELAQYGLPARPSSTSMEYPRWYAAMKAARTEVPDGYTVSDTAGCTSGCYKPWAAVEDLSNTFKEVDSYWYVPSITQTDSASRDAYQWVGLNGDPTTPLIQVGTYTNSNGSTQSYGAWYEVWPNYAARYISGFTVHPGEEIWGIAQNYSNEQNHSYLFIEDLATGSYYTVPEGALDATCSCATAEVVEEDPQNFTTGSPLPMSWVSQAYYYYGESTNTAGGQYWINTVPWTHYDAIDNSGNELAYPTGLAGEGNFSVVRTANG